MVAISHSSKWSSARLSTLSTHVPLSQTETAGSATPDRLILLRDPIVSVHFDVEFLGKEVQHLLPDAALGPGIGWTHRVLPGLFLVVGQVMQGGLAGLLDLLERILVFLDRDRVGVVGRLRHGLFKLAADVRRQSAPELR